MMSQQGCVSYVVAPLLMSRLAPSQISFTIKAAKEASPHMSAHDPHDHAQIQNHAIDRWIDHWWPALVIAFGLLFVTLLVTFNPHT
jgi:hypothetical protein